MSFQPIFAQKSKIMMIKGSKQQQLTFDKGMTNVPSDLLCADNTLSLADGMIFRNGEHHVIQAPKLLPAISAAGTLVFVHKIGDGTENYIYEKTVSDVTSLYYNNSAITGSEHTGEELKSITAIGNTLIVSFNGRLGYFLFNGSTYKDISYIPTPSVYFRLGIESEGGSANHGYDTVESSGSPNGIIGYTGEQPSPTAFYIKLDSDYGGQDKYNNLVTGLYAKNQNTIKGKLGFSEPFCARVALEMYDGSYTHITNPVILLPSIRRNSSAYNQHGIFTLYTNYSKLYCQLITDYSNYSDIVKDVVVFITDGVNIYDTSVDQPSIGDNRVIQEAKHAGQSDFDASADLLTDCIAYDWGTFCKKTKTYRETAETQANRRWIVLKERPQKEISDDLARQSVYYRLCSLGLESMNDYAGVADKVAVHTLESLTTQEQLKYDDYHSHCQMRATFLDTYNNRLNMAGVERGFFAGFMSFLPYEANTTYHYTSYVTIKTSEGEKVISKEYSTNEKQGIWFYYPDPRATHVVIKRESSGSSVYVCDADLREHPGLNGAFYFKGVDGEEEVVQVANTPMPTNSQKESLENYLITSEVNNPLVFRAEGYNRIGNGVVIGMASQTQALSQGQFGQYPLLVFTTEGIWAMSLNNTGLFVAIHPMSREVALENNPAITPVDGAVFFVSKKGLMVVEGNRVMCVSEQLAGKVGNTRLGNFATFLSTAIIAYDYRDSLLWIFDKTNTACWIYSIKSGTFGQFDFGAGKAVTSVVNSYPDFLMQNTDGVFSLLKRPDINNDPSSYSAQLISRPLKLENALALKTIIQAVHVKVLHSGASMTWRVEASNNAVTWVQLSSLTGIPWKYYRFTYTFSHLSATDSFAGTVLITQERRTDKLR